MIHPSTELRPVGSDIGFGVYATRLIPRGSITWVLDALDLVLPEARVKTLTPAYQPILDRYCYRDAEGNYVLCWDFARYMNHSCDANIVSIGSLCDVAARDIQQGEELTCEYALLNLSEELVCQCGSPNCRGRIDSAKLAVIAAEIDEKTKSLMPELARLEQPLREFMLPPQRERLQRILEGKSPIPSCLENRRHA